jgi:polyhydroxybutyrate depolymerase
VIIHGVSAAAKDRCDRLRVDGHRRSYLVHLPKQYDPESPTPLVIVLHGGIGTARTARWDTQMSKQADRDNFIVAYPNGVLRTWNAGECCGPAKRKGVDDIAFLRALIEKVSSDYKIDRDRIYVTGISNGGMLAYRAGYELSDLVAAIAPVAGCMYPCRGECKFPVSVIVFHGAKDHIVPFDGGIGGMLGYKLKSTSEADSIKFWIQHDHCKAEPNEVRDGGQIKKEVYSGGDCGTEVCLYTLKNGGHSWPGGRRAIFIGDKPSTQISATRLMCYFFWEHPKRRVASGEQSCGSQSQRIPEGSPIPTNP